MKASCLGSLEKVLVVCSSSERFPQVECRQKFNPHMVTEHLLAAMATMAMPIVAIMLVKKRMTDSLKV